MEDKMITTIEEFVEFVQRALQNHYGIDYDISIRKNRRNNGVCITGISIRYKDKNLAPTIYMEEFYRAYQEGFCLKEIVKKVIFDYEQRRHTQDFDIDAYTDFNNIKDRIFMKLVNYEKNKEMLEHMPYVVFHDLAIIFYVSLTEIAENAVALVNNNQMNTWQQNPDSLYQISLTNTCRKYPLQILSMQDLLKEGLEKLPEEERDEFEKMLYVTEDTRMYVATNRERINGAAVLLYPAMLKQFAQRIQTDFYILPSSVHELILVPDYGDTTAESLGIMVQDVNEEQVAEEEVLSNSVYYYNRESDIVTRLL